MTKCEEDCTYDEGPKLRTPVAMYRHAEATRFAFIPPVLSASLISAEPFQHHGDVALRGPRQRGSHLHYRQSARLAGGFPPMDQSIVLVMFNRVRIWD